MTTAEGPIQDTPAEAGQTHVFQADVARLLHLMVHSI